MEKSSGELAGESVTTVEQLKAVLERMLDETDIDYDRGRIRAASSTSGKLLTGSALAHRYGLPADSPIGRSTQKASQLIGRVLRGEIAPEVVRDKNLVIGRIQQSERICQRFGSSAPGVTGKQLKLLPGPQA